MYRTAQEAFLGILSEITRQQDVVSPRGHETKELTGVHLRIENPIDRFIAIPYRNNNPFATVAETMWVLSGRNDVQFIRNYLPRADQFSDDGLTWRAGYGPRIRNWNGIDQVRECLNILQGDVNSRRAVMIIFDPGQDFIDSKDIPCNNWIHWLAREGKLHMNIAVRSNDIMWGFSGINTFEWSVLQEMMAYWANLEVGLQSWLIGSMHLYQRHWSRARRILARRPVRPVVLDESRLRFRTPFARLDAILDQWFSIELALRTDAESVSDRVLLDFPDPLFSGFLMMLKGYWSVKQGANPDDGLRFTTVIRDSGMRNACEEYFHRETTNESLIVSPPSTYPDFIAYIRRLHREKDAAYGISWKKRGEQVSICANIARKVDRLENISRGAPAGDETVLDTAIDAFVYSLKYRLFLLDRAPTLRSQVLPSHLPPVSEGITAFEVLLERFQPEATNLDFQGHTRSIVQALADIEQSLNDGASVSSRYALATKLSQIAGDFSTALWKGDIR